MKVLIMNLGELEISKYTLLIGISLQNLKNAIEVAIVRKNLLNVLFVKMKIQQCILPKGSVFVILIVILWTLLRKNLVVNILGTQRMKGINVRLSYINILKMSI